MTRYLKSYPALRILIVSLLQCVNEFIVSGVKNL
jgi:hypothetical protein